ncbi:hypothetical protein RRG08_037737 [Elysia crispata]|uniref:Uncharacterized protein n=1 Tax=Elysia crispata TaxID=231223 RepID=A0AAE1A7J1_9GAST|nr:hypothetical protein RRG08_037737 [Elysia crispata]
MRSLLCPAWSSADNKSVVSQWSQSINRSDIRYPGNLPSKVRAAMKTVKSIKPECDFRRLEEKTKDMFEFLGLQSILLDLLTSSLVSVPPVPIRHYFLRFFNPLHSANSCLAVLTKTRQ